MFGWINDCTECLVLTKFGEETWQRIKEKAGCEVQDGGFLRYKYYPDSDTVQLVVAASEVLGIGVDDVLFAFGDYFIDYVQENGYSNVLECLGSNLRDWLSNLNSLHDHLQASYPKGFVAPVFWSEDDEELSKGAILVHYYSQRGSLLVPLVVGVIKKVARVYFDVEIDMDQLELQDENEAKHTSWRVTTVDPLKTNILQGNKSPNKTKKHRSESFDEEETISTSASTTSRNRTLSAFRKGGAVASDLRAEEVVKRHFLNPGCELYHAFTLEHYIYLSEYWKANKNEDELFCYDVWSMQDDDPSTWASLRDLPSKLFPETIGENNYFGTMVPKTGTYPPGDDGFPQSFPPIISMVNDITGKSKNLVVKKEESLSLEDGIYNHPDIEEANIKEFPSDWQERIAAEEVEIHCDVWDVETDESFHSFSLEDLKTASTKQLYDLIPRSFDPIKIVLRCQEIVEVDEEWEDI
mmetsp:Transcript_21651/g.47288  ORF Transcript_21651/g.47288 Transcript_21651/m.47288 type:complete len:467 (+) Transcript_21651:386-1786(+)|eukprot:CAMPEP_0168187148 /NCGR_PEP_ID=MMETSP0139_2-20121125/14860_1 /TAXON_ID=44445 /ORGANISM="Pseudo-nitzschia australis, Strain 10249 10 AB" /LENGTH=466 /DNA_ID=CAMNT_0008109301 /DNA_START=297 /DNA_END=1697 /DNA_ORIENTATION=+